MANPHPTKCKPFKIGRKHTGAKSLRQKGREMSAMIQTQRRKTSRIIAFKNAVKAYWRNELEEYPII